MLKPSGLDYCHAEYLLNLQDDVIHSFVTDHRIKAAGVRTNCNIELTKRILNRKVNGFKWVKYSILRITGPDEASIRQCNKLIERISPPYKYRKEYLRRAPVVLYTGDVIPDNTSLYYAKQRTGPMTPECGGIRRAEALYEEDGIPREGSKFEETGTYYPSTHGVENIVKFYNLGKLRTQPLNYNKVGMQEYFEKRGMGPVCHPDYQAAGISKHMKNVAFGQIGHLPSSEADTRPVSGADTSRKQENASIPGNVNYADYGGINSPSPAPSFAEDHESQYPTALNIVDDAALPEYAEHEMDDVANSKENGMYDQRPNDHIARESSGSKRLDDSSGLNTSAISNKVDKSRQLDSDEVKRTRSPIKQVKSDVVPIKSQISHQISHQSDQKSRQSDEGSRPISNISKQLSEQKSFQIEEHKPLVSSSKQHSEVRLLQSDDRSKLTSSSLSKKQRYNQDLYSGKAKNTYGQGTKSDKLVKTEYDSQASIRGIKVPEKMVQGGTPMRNQYLTQQKNSGDVREQKSRVTCVDSGNKSNYEVDRYIKNKLPLPHNDPVVIYVDGQDILMTGNTAMSMSGDRGKFVLNLGTEEYNISISGDKEKFQFVKNMPRNNQNVCPPKLYEPLSVAYAPYENHVQVIV